MLDEEWENVCVERRRDLFLFINKKWKNNGSV